MTSAEQRRAVLEAALSHPTATTREVLERMNRSGSGFMLIADAERRLLGTLTDGDVRRAMLSGIPLDAPVSQCMHSKPITGHPGKVSDNLALLAKLPFLPIIDDRGVIIDLLLPGESGRGIQTALVMAGGKGRRLGARTRRRPKPLLPVGDKPMLDRVLERLEAALVPVVYVSVHHLADQIETYLQQRENRCEIHVIREERPLGTAGGFGQVPHTGVEPILVINADVVTRVDLLALASFHSAHENDGTVGVARYDVEVPFGVVRHDPDGRFQRIDEKPTLNFFVSAGIYLLTPAFRALVPPKRAIDMPELLTMGHQAGLRIGLFPIHEYWIDVGRPDDLELARRQNQGRK